MDLYPALLPEYHGSQTRFEPKILICCWETGETPASLSPGAHSGEMPRPAYFSTFEVLWPWALWLLTVQSGHRQSWVSSPWPWHWQLCLLPRFLLFQSLPNAWRFVSCPLHGTAAPLAGPRRILSSGEAGVLSPAWPALPAVHPTEGPVVGHLHPLPSPWTDGSPWPFSRGCLGTWARNLTVQATGNGLKSHSPISHF